LYLNRDDLKDETRQERVDRMKLVRQIQQAFYQDDEMDNHLVETHTDDDWLHNVPMFRVQWTELPGFQNMLNIHVPHYTHMFRRIIKGPKPWRFGHLYLPDGSENLNNPTYKLDPGNPRAATIGTLMQISDVIEDEDGRFGMIVQAIDPFEVVEATQHVPYAMAFSTKRKQLIASFGIASFGIASFGIASFGIASFDFGDFGAPKVVNRSSKIKTNKQTNDKEAEMAGSLISLTRRTSRKVIASLLISCFPTTTPEQQQEEPCPRPIVRMWCWMIGPNPRQRRF
jgi:hypothetical protein